MFDLIQMAPMTEYNNRCPSPPSDYEQEESEEQLANYSRTEIIRLLLKTQGKGSNAKLVSLHNL